MTERAYPHSGWKVGDRCMLAVLQHGKVYKGTIEVVRGDRASFLAVRTDTGLLFNVRADSGFVTRP